MSALWDEDHGDWIDCWQCGGDGVLDSCMEDTCVCLEPPCCTKRCDICKGQGGWVPKPDPAMSAVLGEALAQQTDQAGERRSAAEVGADHDPSLTTGIEE